jgi:hypothetical protein
MSWDSYCNMGAPNQRITPSEPAHGRAQGGIKRDIVAHIEGPRPESWRDRLWLLMTVAGVLLLVCAALVV